MKLSILVAVAMCGSLPVLAESPTPPPIQSPVPLVPMLPKPQGYGGGNAYGGSVGAVGVPITKSVQVGGRVDFSTQPRLQPTGGGVGVTIQHDFLGH
jgi:hypothetical protein